MPSTLIRIASGLRRDRGVRALASNRCAPVRASRARSRRTGAPRGRSPRGSHGPSDRRARALAGAKQELAQLVAIAEVASERAEVGFAAPLGEMHEREEGELTELLVEVLARRMDVRPGPRSR